MSLAGDQLASMARGRVNQHLALFHASPQLKWIALLLFGCLSAFPRTSSSWPWPIFPHRIGTKLKLFPIAASYLLPT